MRLLRRGPKPGTRWGGPATYTTDPFIGPPGFYALADDGSINAKVRLTWIDEAPLDEEDGSGFYEVADPSLPYFSHMPRSVNPNVVSLEAHTHGSSGVEVSDDGE